MIVVVVLISSWYCASKKAWNPWWVAIRTAPWINHSRTRKRQIAKNGARLANRAATPANRSKNPTLLDTSLGNSRGDVFGFALMSAPSIAQAIAQACRVIVPRARRSASGGQRGRDALGEPEDVVRVVAPLDLDEPGQVRAVVRVQPVRQVRIDVVHVCEPA